MWSTARASIGSPVVFSPETTRCFDRSDSCSPSSRTFQDPGLSPRKTSPETPVLSRARVQSESRNKKSRLDPAVINRGRELSGTLAYDPKFIEAGSDDYAR